MLEYYCRPLMQKLFFDPVADFIVKKMSKLIYPNRVTILGCLFGLLVFPALLFNLVKLSIGLLLLSGYCDILDGLLAQRMNKSSNFGAILDILCDRIVEVTVIFALFAVDPLHRAWQTLGMLGSCLICITAFLVVGIFIEKNSTKSFYYSPGIMERAEAFGFFIAMMLFPQYFNVLAYCFIFLVGFSGFFHVWQFRMKNA